MTRALAAGMAALLIAAFLPVNALAEEASSSTDQTEAVVGDTEDTKNTENEEVGSLRLARGKHGRKMWRANRWADQLSGDKAEVYNSYGMPSSRYREDTLGRVEETWTYLGEGIEITFRGDSIIRTRRITPVIR